MNTIEIVHDFLRDRIGEPSQSLSSEQVLADIGVDSLMLLELFFEFEDKLGIELPDDIGTPRTLGDLITLIDGLRETGNDSK